MKRNSYDYQTLARGRPKVWNQIPGDLHTLRTRTDNILSLPQRCTPCCCWGLIFSVQRAGLRRARLSSPVADRVRRPRQRVGVALALHAAYAHAHHRAEVLFCGSGPSRSKACSAVYSKELSLRNQPLETQRWIQPQCLGNRLAGLSVSKKTHLAIAYWKPSAGFGANFLETRLCRPW